MERNNNPSTTNMMVAALLKTFEVVQQMAKTCPPTNEDIRRRCTFCEEKGQYIFSQFTETERPSPNHVRAILFPAKETKPRFIWIEQFSERDYHFPIIDCWLAPYARHSNMISDMNALLAEAGHDAIGHGLVMIGLHEQPLPNVPINKSILSLGQPGHMKSWFGNQIIIGRQPNKVGSRGITLDDVTLRDLRHAVDLYQHHPLNLCVVNPSRYKFPIVPGVIIHCDGALQRFEKFGLHCRVESVVLRRDQAKNSKVTEARMSQGLCIGLMKLGLKWSYRHHTARQEWLESDITSQSLLNVTAKHMVYKIDKRNGRCCVHPVRNAGTIVVFDQLGRTLDPAQIRAINAYFGQISRPMSQLAGEKPMNVLARQRSEQKFARCATIQPTVEGFQYFWAQWKEDEKATSVQRVTIETFHSEVEEPIDLDKAVTGGHYEGITQRMKAIAL